MDLKEWIEEHKTTLSCSDEYNGFSRKDLIELFEQLANDSYSCSIEIFCLELMEAFKGED